MSAYLTRFAFAAAACALAAPASAQTIARKDLSVDAAVIIATTAMADCKAKGWPVSVAVVGRNGELLVHLRGDGTGPHTMDNSYRKAFTSRTFRHASGEMARAPEEIRRSARSIVTRPNTGRGAGRAADQDRRGHHRRGRRLRRAGRREGRGLHPDRARQDQGSAEVTRKRHSGPAPTGPREARPDDRLRAGPGIQLA